MCRDALNAQQRRIADEFERTFPATFPPTEVCLSAELVRLARACTLLQESNLRYIRPVYSQLDAPRPAKDKPCDWTASSPARLKSEKAETPQAVSAFTQVS